LVLAQDSVSLSNPFPLAFGSVIYRRVGFKFPGIDLEETELAGKGVSKGLKDQGRKRGLFTGLTAFLLGRAGVFPYRFLSVQRRR